MVVCKFFLQGTCKFGDYCKFEHNLDKYHYQYNSSSILRQPTFPGYPSKPLNNPLVPVNKSNTNPNIDMNALMKILQTDMLTAEKGGMWRLTCYGPLSDHPSLPDLEDESFEEVRLGFYESKSNNTLGQFKQQWQQLLQNASLKWKSLKTPRKEILQILKTLYKQPGDITKEFGTSGSVFGGFRESTTTTSSLLPSQHTSIFAQAAAANSQTFGIGNGQNSGTSIFGGATTGAMMGQNKSIFGGQQQVQQQSQSVLGNKSSFGFSSTDGASLSSSIFGSLNLNRPQLPQNMFQSTESNSNLLTNNSNIFASNSTFGQNPVASVFGGTPQMHTPSLFGAPATPITTDIQRKSQTPPPSYFTGNRGQSQMAVVDESAYSKKEDLSKDNIKWFESDTIDIVGIPEKAPTLEMCFN